MAGFVHTYCLMFVFYVALTEIFNWDISSSYGRGRTYGSISNAGLQMNKVSRE